MILLPSKARLSPAWRSVDGRLQHSGRGHGRPYSQFAAAYDLSVAKDLYWLSALWNDAIFDWTIPEIEQLVQFPKGAVPPLFT